MPLFRWLMNGSKQRKALARVLLAKLTPFELQLLRGRVPATDPAGYDAALANVRQRLPLLEAGISHGRERLRERCSQPGSLPGGSPGAWLEDGSPLMLLTLAHGLMDQSYAERFRDVRRSRELAELAVEASALVARTRFLAAPVAADLEAEALVYLGNGCRIDSDLRAAEDAFARAEELRRSGTRTRELRAHLLRHLALLRHDQGRTREAVRLTDREIAIRRHLGDDERLGEALINRGLVSMAFESLSTVCQFLKAGVEHVSDPKIQVLALLPLSEVLAREGEGLQAWKVTHRLETLLIPTGFEELRVRSRHTKGIALRVLGQLEDAERELAAVRGEYAAQGRPLMVAIAALDLTCVCAARGKVREVKALAREALEILAREGVETGAVRAVLTLQRAAEAERSTERLAVEVVNQVVRSRLNRRGGTRS